MWDLWRILKRSSDQASVVWLTTSAILVCVGGASASLAPLALKRIIDGLEPGAPYKSFAWLIGAYILALLVQRGCEPIQAFAYGRGEQRLISRFSNQAFAHMLALPLAFHLDGRAGAHTQTIANGTNGLRLILAHLAMSVAPIAVQLLLAATIMVAALGPAIATAVLVAMLAYAVVFAWGVTWLGEAAKAISTAQIDTGAATTDSLMNIETIKAFTAEARFVARHDRSLAETEAKWALFLRRRLVNGLAVAMVFCLAMGATHLLAGDSVAAGRLSLGGLVMINAYLLQLLRPLEVLGFAFRDIAQSLAYLGALRTVMRHEAEVTDALVDVGTPNTPADLTFENVSFTYGSERKILEGISFHASPGATLGIVGPSGAGKSSLLRLVLRFFEPTEGEIRLDGRSIAAIPLGALRGQIALVSQDTILFNDTIRANIGLAAERPDDRELHDAVERARLSDLLAQLPEGLETLVGERGLKLSGGEKQRISIARAALKRARLVIFDEATAALDPSTEQAVWAAMRNIAQSTTTLIVTHRLATVSEADEILVLDRGCIVQRGRHAELMVEPGLYRQLWRAQTSKNQVETV
ncbi:ABC transporter ATP-binding protein [Phenylobacterium sp.]|uniref:ABC transporter ATP-binding protein n=1 Tax=Phenylobacterium sp. TaxID=1871053 RepID=UPI002FCC055C